MSNLGYCSQTQFFLRRAPNLQRRIMSLNFSRQKVAEATMFALKTMDVPTQITGHPGHSLPETTEKVAVHLVSVRDIPRSGSGISRHLGA